MWICEPCGKLIGVKWGPAAHYSTGGFCQGCRQRRASRIEWHPGVNMPKPERPPKPLETGQKTGQLDLFA